MQRNYTLCFMSLYIRQWQENMREKMDAICQTAWIQEQNWTVCVWEAQLVKDVSLNLTQPVLRDIHFTSYCLHLCTHNLKQPPNQHQQPSTSGTLSLPKLLQTERSINYFKFLNHNDLHNDMGEWREKAATNKSKLEWSCLVTGWWATSPAPLHQMQNQRDCVLISRQQSQKAPSLSRGTDVLAAGCGARGTIAFS